MTPAQSIAIVTVCVGALFYSTIQNNSDIEREVFACGGSTLPEGFMPGWLTSRFPATWTLNPIREIHCANSKGIRFPIQSQAVLNDRWIHHCNAHVSENLIKVLAKNDQLDYVHLDFTELNDTQLETLSESDNITLLGICGTRCTDAGMKQLQKYERLESLYVCELPITDVGAAQIAKCRTLKYLNIYQASITPVGLEKLFRLPNLETLVVTDAKEYKATLAKWKKKLPKLKVVEIESATDEEGNPRVKDEEANPPRNLGIIDTDELVKQLRKALQERQ